MLRRLALPGLVLVLGGIALWRQRDRSARGTPADDAAPRSEPSPAAPTPALAPASEPASAAPAPVEDDVEPVESAESDGGSLQELLEVERGSASVAGTVLWPDGTPAAGARVDAKREIEGGARYIAAAESDASGRFVLAGLPEDGVLEIVASHAPPGVEEPAADLQDWRVADLAPSERWSVVAGSVRPGTSDLVLTLLEPLSVSGTVVDEGGGPVRSFWVSGRPTRLPESQSYGAGGFFETTNGAFTFGAAPAGEWSFVAHDPAQQRASTPVTLVLPQGSTTLRLVLPRAAVVAGHVLLPRGGPAADAEVHVESALATEDEPIRCDPDGSFRLEPGVPSLTIRATHPEWAASESVRLELAPGESRILLALREGARITGEVVNDDGAGQAGWNVRCASGEEAMGLLRRGRAERAALTDESGRFALEHVTPGRVSIDARPAQLADAADDTTPARSASARGRTVEVADRGEAHVVLRTNPPRPVRVHGRVLAAEKPLAKRSVRARFPGRGVRVTESDDDGRYEIELEHPGDAVFEVAGDEPVGNAVARFYVELPEAREFELDLALPLGRISGLVLGPDAPAARARLRLVAAAGALGPDDFADTTTAADGSFAFEHLRGGTYALHVMRAPSEYEPRHGEIVVDGLEVAEDRALDGLLVRLARPGTLAGTVRDSSGVPRADVTVFVRDSAGHALALTDCTTEADGTFVYHGVTPGLVTAIARSARLAGEGVAVQVRAGETSTVELVLSEGAFLRVSLLDGERAVSARLRVLDGTGGRVDGLVPMDAIAQPASEREHRVGPLAPGPYTLIATTLDGREARETVLVELQQEERKVELRLE